MSWLNTAKSLPLEGRRKIKHCSTEPSAYVNHNLNGYSIKCFRCGDTEFVPKSEHSLKELVERRNKALNSIPSKPELPSDAQSCTEANSKALYWLLSAGCSPEEADSNGIRWHEQSERLLMSVYDEHTNTVGIIARAVNGEKPKYRVISGNSSLHFPHSPSKGVVVVVEDILSSIALARAGLDSVALLGTSLQGVDAYRIAHNREAVIGFFDPDKAGQQAYRQLRSAMQLHPVNVYKASADKDPKYLSKDQLWRAINNALNVQE